VIYIRIELWPKGNRKGAMLLHEATIENLGTGSETRGNYLARLSKRSGFRAPKGLFSDAEAVRVLSPTEASVWKSTELEDFPRQARNVLDLFYRVLHLCVGGRN